MTWAAPRTAHTTLWSVWVRRGSRAFSIWRGCTSVAFIFSTRSRFQRKTSSPSIQTQRCQRGTRLLFQHFFACFSEMWLDFFFFFFSFILQGQRSGFVWVSASPHCWKLSILLTTSSPSRCWLRSMSMNPATSPPRRWFASLFPFPTSSLTLSAPPETNFPQDKGRGRCLHGECYISGDRAVYVFANTQRGQWPFFFYFFFFFFLSELSSGPWRPLPNLAFRARLHWSHLLAVRNPVHCVSVHPECKRKGSGLARRLQRCLCEAWRTPQGSQALLGTILFLRLIFSLSFLLFPRKSSRW